MAALPTIPETITYADISVGLSANYQGEGVLWGRRVQPVCSPITLAIVTDALRWGNSGGAQTAELLRNIRNYLVWLMNPFGMEAQAIIAGGGGGSVVPGGGVGYVYTELPVTITTAGTTYTNSDLYLGTELRYVILNNQVLTVLNGDFTFNSGTSTITFLTMTLSVNDTLLIPYNKKL